MNIDWQAEAEAKTQELIEKTTHLIAIPSVYREAPGENAPFGNEIKDALEQVLTWGEERGFTVRNVDGYAGHLELEGISSDCVGILCHLDVVPAGTGWTYSPFGKSAEDGKIYGRGALDDKGPAIASFLALSIIKELKLPLKRSIRLILGTDEERNWGCMAHYFANEREPLAAFTPDANFPLITSEKGIIDGFISFSPLPPVPTAELTLHHIQSGEALNMVAAEAKAACTFSSKKTKEKALLLFEQRFAQEKGHIDMNGEVVTFHVEGVSAHGSIPSKGKNAAVLLCSFLRELPLSLAEQRFCETVEEGFGPGDGSGLGLQLTDEFSGGLTVNLGRISYSEAEGGDIGINIRYPVSFSKQEIMRQLLKAVADFNGTWKEYDHLAPHYVKAETKWVQTLSEVYERQTGEKGEALSTGGGTYARALEKGVAFGPLLPGRESRAHQSDEYMEIADLVKCTAIYAEAIYRLAVQQTLE
ncbi:dipeptidase PepV [Salsuginibacillus kocurii]|uniref:dipeptidase PepV n=1 Tax=Salsuginibacillus kocurii TaxID=427078 RepID=UPI00036D7E16|nr:dipeptidase PepV [Salsuginibacillus kocurii]